MKLIVAVNDAGLRIGESHPKAELTDAEVELVRRLHEQGWTYSQLAQKFDQSAEAIGRMCRYERRGQTAARFKTVHIPSD